MGHDSIYSAPLSQIDLTGKPSAMSDIEACCEPCPLTDVEDTLPPEHVAPGYLAQLEINLGDLMIRNNELEQRLQKVGEQLEEEVEQRGVMGLDRDLLIDALMEKTQELRQRDQTIQTQNCLLDQAWADAQNLASCQQASQEALELLKEYVECVLASEDVNANKKRRLCS